MLTKAAWQVESAITFTAENCCETIYDRDVWKWAEGKGYLEKLRSMPSVMGGEIADGLMHGDVMPEVHEQWKIFVFHEFGKDGKVPTAEYVASWNDADFKKRLPCLGKLVGQIVSYLFPPHTTQQ